MICHERVVIVTGAGRGLGREHALELGRQGARVVVNDLGVSADGSGRADGPAREVVEMIRASGGEAVTSFEDVADWEGAGRIVRVGKLPIKLNAGLFYNVVQPTYGGRWVLNAQLTLIF